MALGAERGQVLSLVLRHGMILVGIGTAIGLAGAYAAARGLSAMFFGVGAMDPLVYCGVTFLLASVAAAAAVAARANLMRDIEVSFLCG